MRIATASLNQTPLDWNRNADHIRRAVDLARRQDTMVVCLPELCIPGAGCGLHFRRRDVLDRSLDVFFELLGELKGMIATLGLPIEYEGHVFNTACLVVDGKPLGFQAKTNFSGSNFRELTWFRPWMRNRHSTFELNGETYKIGDLSFEFQLNEEKTFHVAVEVGESDWNAPGPPAASERHKVDLLFNPAASRFSFGKDALRRRYAESATAEHDFVFVFSNYVGNESGPSIYDGGALIAEKGRILAATPRFSYQDAQVAVATLGDDAREAAASVPPREEELARIAPLGLLDYLRKSGASGFALSLSGGADSASIAALVALGVRFARDELGPEQFARAFGFVPGVEASMSVKEIVRRMLVCFYQGTKNSGATTRRAARTVATELGAEFHELDVDKTVDDYVALVSKALEYEPTWAADDLALQNIQARARVPAAWLIANLRNAVLLATGNRSEATLGYTTMDGDTCGALAPIGGVDKAFLRDWLRWLETTGPAAGTERVAMPFLSVVNSQQPAAELKPPEHGQTDERDMMPYAVLNRIERLGPVEGKSPEEIFAVLRSEFPDDSVDDLSLWIDRFFRRWLSNQWKRGRYAMSFHLDDSSLSAEEWRAFPVLTGRER